MDPLNKDFIRLVAKAGWNKSETARRLELTPAVITRYFNGETRPSLTTIKLFKLILGDLSPLPGKEGSSKTQALDVGYKTLSPWEEDLLLSIRKLDRGDARKLAIEFRVIADMLPRGKSPAPTKD